MCDYCCDWCSCLKFQNFLGFSLSIRYLPINAPARKANNEAKAIFYFFLQLLYSLVACLSYLIITFIWNVLFKNVFFFELEKLKFCIYFIHVIFIIQQSTLLNLIVSNFAKGTKYLTYIHTNKRRNTVHKLKHTYICKPVRTCCTKNVYKNRNFVVKAMWTQIKQSHEKRNKNTKSNNNKDSSKSILYKHIYKQMCQQ